MNCTWKLCDKIAVHDCKDRNDETWASLCKEHKQELDDSFAAMDLKRIERCWKMAAISKMQ